MKKNTQAGPSHKTLTCVVITDQLLQPQQYYKGIVNCIHKSHVISHSEWLNSLYVALNSFTDQLSAQVGLAYNFFLSLMLLDLITPTGFQFTLGS